MRYHSTRWNPPCIIIYSGDEENVIKHRRKLWNVVLDKLIYVRHEIAEFLSMHRKCPTSIFPSIKIILLSVIDTTFFFSETETKNWLEKAKKRKSGTVSKKDRGGSVEHGLNI